MDGYQVEFGRIGAILADGDGNMYIADVHEAAREIVVLDGTGSRIGLIGRAGSGPGEFTDLVPTLAWSGDTIIAVDKFPGGQRLIRFTKNGVVVGTSAPMSAAVAARLFTGGRSAYMLQIAQTPVDGARFMDFDRAPPLPIVESRYFTVASNGETNPLSQLRDSAFGIGGWNAVVLCRSSDRRSTSGFLIPFGDRGPLRAFTPWGALAKADARSYRIDILNVRSAEIVRTIRRDISPVPLHEDRWRAQLGVREMLDFEREFGGPLVALGPDAPCPLYDMKPTHLPAMRTILTDEHGRFWVETSSEQGFNLALFDSDGSFLGGTPMPDRDPNVTPYARGNLLYIVTRDSLDVQGVEVYEMLGG